MMRLSVKPAKNNYYALIFLCCMIWSVAVVCFSYFFNETKGNIKSEECIPSATQSIQLNNTAFITGGIGKYGKLPEMAKCFAFAESLIRIGGWHGNIYILTDTIINNVNKSLIFDSELVKLVHMEPIRDGIDFRQHLAGGRGGYLKTMIFDLDEIKQDILIWHDCDKLIAETNCISNTFSKHENFLDFNAKSNIYIGNDANVGKCYKNNKWNRCGDSIHVGIFAAHRIWSAKLISAWGARQQNEPSTLDRYTFYDAWTIDFASMPMGVHKLPKMLLDHFWNVGDVECVNHITNGRLSVIKNRLAFSSFVSSFCLETVKDDLLLKAYLDRFEWINYIYYTIVIIIIIVIGILLCFLLKYLKSKCQFHDRKNTN